MARVAVLALPELLGEIIVEAGKRLPQATIVRFGSARDLLQGIIDDDFDATIIANPDVPAAKLVPALHAEDAGLFVVIINGHSMPADRSLVHIMKLDSNTADEAVQFIIDSFDSFAGGKRG